MGIQGASPLTTVGGLVHRTTVTQEQETGTLDGTLSTLPPESIGFFLILAIVFFGLF